MMSETGRSVSPLRSRGGSPRPPWTTTDLARWNVGPVELSLRNVGPIQPWTGDRGPGTGDRGPGTGDRRPETGTGDGDRRRGRGPGTGVRDRVAVVVMDGRSGGWPARFCGGAPAVGRWLVGVDLVRGVGAGV